MKIGTGVAAVALVAVIFVFTKGIPANGGDPETNLRQAITKLSEAETLRFDGNLTLSLPARPDGTSRPFNVVEARMRGDARQVNDKRDYEMQGRIYLEAKGRGNSIFSDGQIILLDDKTLFNLEELPALLNPGMSLTGKWVKVPGAMAHTNNPMQVFNGLMDASSSWEYQKEETWKGRRVLVYQGALPSQVEKDLAAMWQQSASGNRGLGVLARLMNTSDVKIVEIRVDTKSQELVEIKAIFDRETTNGSREEAAVVSLGFSDYGKAVDIAEPEASVELDPQLFKSLFGAGELPQ